MGKVYKRKKHSCAMCKPHKMGWEPKKKPKEMASEVVARKEMDRAVKRWLQK